MGMNFRAPHTHTHNFLINSAFISVALVFAEHAKRVPLCVFLRELDTSLTVIKTARSYEFSIIEFSVLSLSLGFEV